MAALWAPAMLSGCAGSTKLVRPEAPPTPANFGTPVTLPAPKIGEGKLTFALKNRAAAKQANKRLEDDRAHWEAVRSRVLTTPEEEKPAWPFGLFSAE